MRWKERPQGSNWGEFGPDDQLGRTNLIGRDQVIRGAAEVRAGLSFCLSLPLDSPGGHKLNPRRHAPVLQPTFRDDNAYVNFPLAKLDPVATDVISDDQVLLSLQYSTQWDSLAHVGALFDSEGNGKPTTCYYNGYKADEHIVGPVAYAQDAPFTAHACGQQAGIFGTRPVAFFDFDWLGIHADAYSLSAQVVAILRSEGMTATVSSIHINGWFGAHNKWEGARWIVRELFGRDLDAEIGRWVYVGDSTNDQLMFEHFPHIVGVANIARFLPDLSHSPRYLTQGARGAGFAELVQAIVATR